MENKHTPGPWFPVDYAGSICIQNGPMYDDLDILCYDSIFSDTTPESKETVEANAKLMAAAPEMLLALQSLVSDFEGDYVMPDGEIVDHPLMILLVNYKIAQKAIKKATQ